MARRLPAGIRRALSVPIRGVPFPILGGPNKGRLWSVAALGRGVLTGQYERERFSLLQALVSEGDHVWDIGAHRGYVTLLAAGEVGPTGSVVAFEPAATNRWYLERHLSWNRVPNARALAYALGATNADSTIGGGGGSVSLAVGKGTEPIQLRSGTSLLLDDGVQPPTFLKIDVEGSEGDVLEGAGALLRPSVIALISIHSAGAYARCADLLRRANLAVHVSPQLAANLRSDSQGWHGDPDLVALGSDRAVPRETLDRFGFAPAEE